MSTPPTPPWPPRTEQQLDDARVNKLLVESHVLDLKRELPASDSGNRDIAKDIASFAVDGGVILIGVDEGPPVSLNPVSLAGLRERIEQVGLSRVDEPVQVTTYEIPTSSDSTLGYVVVEVAVSGRAPHMADGRYYSRGDSKNNVLSDPEVMRWHERKIADQQDLKDDAKTELERLRNNSPQPVFNLLIAAKPLGARSQFLMELSTSGSWRSDLGDLMLLASVGCHNVSSLRQPTQIERHADGMVAVADLTKPEESAGYNRAEIVLNESSGHLTLLSGGLIRYVEGSSPARHAVAEPRLLAQAEFIVHLAGAVSAYGFNGPWQFALAANMLGKTRSYTLSTNHDYDGPVPVYGRFGYERSYTSGGKEIISSPQIAVRELVAPLLRSLGSDGQFPWLFT